MSLPLGIGRGRGLFIGRCFGIAIHLDYSWFIIAGVITYVLTKQWFPSPEGLPGLTEGTYLLMGISASLIFFISLLLHELGHSVISQHCGIPVPRITLFLIGGVAEISREPDDARSELKIALGGPAVSLVLVIFYQACQLILSSIGLNPAAAVCQWLVYTNLWLILFNMIPGYPLDGGRVLRALIWAKTGKLRKATFITSRIGIGFSWLLVLLSAFLILQLHVWNGVVFLVVALFIKNAAESGYHNAVDRETLAGITVADVMTPRPICIPADMPANLAVEDFFLANHHVAFPVCGHDGTFRGLLRLEHLKDLSKDKWPYTTAETLAAKNSKVPVSINAEESAASAMRRLLAPGFGRLAVTRDGKVVGVVTRHDILHFVRIHTELEE